MVNKNEGRFDLRFLVERRFKEARAALATLGFDANEQPEDDRIKKKYYKLAKNLHPDKGGDTEKFQRIGDAWQVLSDPLVRV